METLAVIGAYVVSPAFVEGAWLTVRLSVAALAGGFAIGLLLALLQEIPGPFVRWLALGYLWVFRGTPVLFQLIFVFNVLPSFGLLLSGFASAVLSLALNEGANMSEILRSGLRAVPAGQRRAAKALGLTPLAVLRVVVLPQALRVVLPAIGNQLINMLRLSAIVSVIAVQDLMLVANQEAASNFRYLEALVAAGLYYLAITTGFMALQSLLERAVDRRRRHRFRLIAPAEQPV